MAKRVEGHYRVVHPYPGHSATVSRWTVFRLQKPAVNLISSASFAGVVSPCEAEGLHLQIEGCGVQIK